MSLPKPNPVEPPWYGPVCPVVWEGWHREVSPYPDQRPLSILGCGQGSSAGDREASAHCQRSELARDYPGAIRWVPTPIEPATIDAHRAAEAAADLERRLDDQLRRAHDRRHHELAEDA
jgi:hypothetical protein